MDIQQKTADLETSLLDQVRGLLTDQVWTIIALVLLGMVVGIATTQFVKVFKPPLPDADPKTRDERFALYTKTAYVAGALWTFGILLGILTGGWVARIIAGLGLAMIAGAGTPRMYDALTWAWAWLVARAKSMFGPKDPPK